MHLFVEARAAGPRLDRLRRASAGGLLLTLALCLGSSGAEATPPWHAPRPDPDLEALRERVTGEFLAPSVDEAHVRRLVQTLRADGSWPGIDYEDFSRTGYQHRVHLANLVEMARAYRKPGSALTGDRALKRAISSAIDFWIRHDFIAANWHSNQIANPSDWNRILLLMDEELTEEQAREIVRMASRANLHAWGARPGGDYIKIAGLMAERALFERDALTLAIAARAIAGEARFTSGRGLKPDYSFNHRTDRVISTLSYGTGYAAAFADWAARLAGTRYALPEDAVRLVTDFFLDGITRTTVHGRYPDPGAKNRGMSRPGSLEPLAPDLPRDLLAASTYRADELRRIAEIRTGNRTPDLEGDHFFWHIEYHAHQRPDWFASTRMHSARTLTMEAPHNEESLKHHHYSDGSNFISRTGDEYRDIYPVWDWQKIPGTTIVQKPALPGPDEIVQAGRKDFVGGVSDGRYGAAAFDFASPLDPLSARKAWFYFDDELVALGAGIESTSDHPVATTLNQTLLRGDVRVGTGSGGTDLRRGSHQLDAVRWVHHDGVGYVFPQPAEVRIEAERRTGRWSEISGRKSLAALPPEQKEVFTLWLDHGRRPSGASYAYIVAPGVEAEGLRTYAEAPPVRIASNNARLQAVRHERLGLTQAVFYEPGAVEVAPGVTVAAETPGLVMVETEGGRVRRLSVADPTRKLEEMRLRVGGGFEGQGAGWRAAPAGEGSSEVRVELPRGAYAGATVVLDPSRPGRFFPARPDTRARAGADPRLFERIGGGVLFWVDPEGSGGLIAAAEDQGAGVPWATGEPADTHTHAAGEGPGTGERNTLMVAQAHGDEAAAVAARLCLDYRGGGFDDWYLPSKDELDLMYRSRDRIGGFANDLYWSSTEYNVGFAWEQYFYGYGGQYTSPKGGGSRVRCVRRVVGELE